MIIDMSEFFLDRQSCPYEWDWAVPRTIGKKRKVVAVTIKRPLSRKREQESEPARLVQYIFMKVCVFCCIIHITI